MTSKKEEYVYLCSSFACCGEEIFHFSKMKIKEVRPYTMLCPDCKYALFQMKKTTLEAKRKSKTKSNRNTYGMDGI